MNTPARPALTRPVTPPPAEDIRFLNIEEAAALLRVSKLTVYRLVHSGDLAAMRTGRAWYVPRDAALAYLDAPDVARTPDRPAPTGEAPRA
ncbi:helix-turn-helix domain-containing protein [Kitasatospora sp. NPDC058162]|uniref:helix-turn-helix domain-containing protein n=1 Tax=Kitasatospora sp. NPDC058162 TaxID=3346362 RepID=UPI0036D94387